MCAPLLTLLHRVSRYRLKDDQFVSRNLRGLLERGVQKAMDLEEPKGPVNPSAPPLAIETMLWYTLGAEGVLPSRHIVSLLRVFKQFTHLIPSGQMENSFKTYSPL